MSAEIIAHLLDEMEEYYGAFDHFPLYLLGWDLNDRVSHSPRKETSSPAGVRRVHGASPTKVVWVAWPLDWSGHARSNRARLWTSTSTRASRQPVQVLVPD